MPSTFGTDKRATTFGTDVVVIDALVPRASRAWGVQIPTEAVLVSGVDVTNGSYMEVTLTAARLVGVPLNAQEGHEIKLTLIQGGAGAFAVTWNAIFKGITGGTSGATGTRATFAFIFDGTNWNLIGAQPTWV